MWLNSLDCEGLSETLTDISGIKLRSSEETRCVSKLREEDFSADTLDGWETVAKGWELTEASRGLESVSEVAKLGNLILFSKSLSLACSSIMDEELVLIPKYNKWTPLFYLIIIMILYLV